MRVWQILPAAILLAGLLAIPGAAAQEPNTIRVRVTPEFEEVALAPNERGHDDLTVEVTISGACSPEAVVSVDLPFAEPFPRWAGASVEPPSTKHAWPGESKPARLEFVPDWEEAPRGSTVTYVIRPRVHLPNETVCTGPFSVDAPDASVRLFLAPTPAADGDGGARTPGFLIGTAVLALLLSRRAFR